MPKGKGGKKSVMPKPMKSTKSGGKKGGVKVTKKGKSIY